LFEKDAPLSLRPGPRPVRVLVSRRVGIRKASERLLRFYDPESPAVSARPRADIS
jgi:3-methyladenine DNA glycosylase Mpg